MKKITLVTFVSAGILGAVQVDTSVTTVSAKKKLQETKYVKTYSPSVAYNQGNGAISSANSTVVYNEKKKPIDVLIIKSKLTNPYTDGQPKQIKNLTLLLENNKKLYYKNGLFYSNSKKTKLLMENSSLKKYWPIQLKQEKVNISMKAMHIWHYRQL
ncbi:MAG: hypothetical protein KBT36_03640 [Kurthia sp.]|nr:hypothetical protein [Candidatus Kurthia equi]